MLVNGQWKDAWQPHQGDDPDGAFVRQSSGFRNWVTPDGAAGLTGTGGFRAEAGRYHLYVALTCPWASRVLMARKLKGLEAAIGVTVVEPILSDQGWRFGDYPGSDRDGLNGAEYLHEVYAKADAAFTGRATVPVLWDTKHGTIVNNESSDILRMLGGAFDAFATRSMDLYPEHLRASIDGFAERIYAPLNNGVYRAGFAQTQPSYEAAFHDVFTTLDEMEALLGQASFLFGEQITEADIRLFVTLVRFDIAYHGIFKCNLRRVADYPGLAHYVDAMMALPGIAETVSFDHIKRGYYSIKALNPSLIVPAGPDPRSLPGARSRDSRKENASPGRIAR
jgi:glutathionyl-hydroquinone reductase